MNRKLISLFICSCLFAITVIQQPLRAQTLKEAIQLTESEQFDQAGLAFKKLIEQAPNNGKYYFYAGENIMKSYLADSTNVSFKEIADSAMQLYSKGNKEDPKNPLNLVGMGNIELLRGEKVKGQQYFEQAQVMVKPKLLTGKSAVSNADIAVVLMKIAESYIHSSFNDTNITMPLLRDAENFDPKNPEIYIVHGDAFLTCNDGVNAILYYNKAKDLNPKSPKALMRTGNLYYRNTVYLVALDYYKQAIKIDSTFAPVYREIGKVYTLARQYDNASAAYKKFLDLSANNIAAKNSYARVLISGKQYDKAIPLILEIYKADSTRNDLNRALAYSYYETNQYDNGLIYIARFFSKTKPEKVIISDWIYYGKLLSRTKQDSLAIEKYKKAYALDSTNFDLLGEMATSYSRMKNYPKAAWAFEKLLKKDKPSYVDFYNLGRAYMNMKEYLKADSVMAIVNTMQPDFIPAYTARASANATLDPETTEGKAKPFYEAIIEKLAADPGKFTRDLTSAYEYLGYFYLRARNYPLSKDYYSKALALDPNNKNAIDALDTLKKYK